MNSGVVRLVQIMSKSLKLNKNRSQSLLLRFALHMPNIILLNLNCIIIGSAQAVKNISESSISNSSEPIKLAHLQK